MRGTKSCWCVLTSESKTVRFSPAVIAVFFAISSASAQTRGENPREVFDRAVSDFERGRVVESAAGFDNLVKLVPDSAPQLWQRGIALYYAGRYKDCRAQFELHRTVNPNDVENAVWHFLCVARQESPDKAKSALLPVGPDSRVPMRQVYDMFRGVRRPEEVLTAGGAEASGQFYAQLYVGLYYEALGNKPKALEHITAAAAERFAAVGGYMHTVAKVHLGILQRGRD
jgi:tetratricopeptide (TPR) repeat protein